MMDNKSSLRYCPTEETRAKVSESLKSFYKNHPSPKLTKEHKQKISLGRKAYFKKHPYTEERKREISEAEKQYYKTHTHKRKGRPQPKEAVQKTAMANRRYFATDPIFRAKRLEIMKKAGEARNASWADPIKRRKRVEAIIKASWRRPTEIEGRIIDIVIKYHLPYKYVGDGKFILGGKNPDFLNTNGGKKLIDIFGDYWHRGGLVEEKKRVECFTNYGFKDLIIWASEMRVMTDKQIARVIEKF